MLKVAHHSQLWRWLCQQNKKGNFGGFCSSVEKLFIFIYEKYTFFKSWERKE